MSNSHLVILKKFYLDKILDGSKKVESRLIRSKVPPYDAVAVGDRLFLKESCGPVCAVAQAAGVRQFSNLTPSKISELKAKYNHSILGAEDYWCLKSDCKFAVLIRLKNVIKIKPVRINKKDWRAWVVLKHPNDFGLLDISAPSGDIIQQTD